MSIFFQCLGITGIVFIFYGFLSFAITQANTAFFWSLMALGFVFLGAFIVSWLRLASKKPSMFRDLFQSKSIKSGAGSLVYSILFVASVIVANVLSSRFFHFEKDFTADQVHTLSEQTIKKLAGLTEKLKITAFLDDRNEAKLPFKEIAKKYQDQSKNVELAFIDADKDKLKAQELNAKDGDVFIEYKGQSNLTRELSESGLTQAILKVSRTTSQTICFTSGHGELSLEEEGENPRSASFLKQGLAADGLTIKSLDNSASGIPAECNILMVAGPEQAFTPVEAASIDMYLTQGGKAVFLLDPNITSAQLSKAPLTIKDSGLEAILSKWGANVGKNVVLEKQMQLFAGVQISPTIRAQKYGDQPITEPLKKGKQTVFDRVRSVQKSASFAGTAVELVFSGGNGGSWAQADIDAAFRQQTVKPSSGDIQGPVSLAIYAEKESDVEGKKLKTQIVVVGDSDFASNAMIRANEFNFDLILNSVTYLGGANEQISIRPKAIKASAIELSPEQANTIFYVAIISLPMLVLTFGLNLWWYRKQKA